MTHLLRCVVLFGLLFPLAPLWAADDAIRRSISVSGDAEMKVVPDQVLLTLGVETRNKDLNEVKRAHDQRLKDVLAALVAAGVDSKDMRSDYVQLVPEYDHSSTSRRRTFIEYVERTTLVVTLRDVAKFEPLLTAVLRAGVEYIHGVDFRTSELRKHRDEARAQAIKAAREKALALAAVLGQKVGKPRSIQEGHGGYWSSYGGWWGRGYQAVAQNVSQFAGNAGTNEESPLAPGTISVRATVTVVFDLE